MASEAFKITGVSFNEWGKRLSPENYKKKIARLMQEALIAGVDKAKVLCPYDAVTHKKGTPHLRDTIYGKLLNERTAILGATANYASENEWGWYGIPDVGTMKEPKFYKGGYRPYLRPGIYKMEQIIRQRAHVVFEEMIEGA